ncbi:MAG TPA: hypothetical protein VJQ56_06370, partial [Blastocatellia bacterium]|nr:hypothetical protein [Blastocatellia bacterium]
DFSSAARAIERGEITEAQEAVTHLAPGIERAMIWLGIAHARAEAKERTLALEAALAVLKEARKVEDARRPFLILGATGELAKIDSVIAVQALMESVKEFNNETTESVDRVRWSQAVEAGTTWRDFRLEVKGAEFGFGAVIPLMAGINSDWTIEIVSNLKNEELLGKAWVAVAATLLN